MGLLFHFDKEGKLKDKTAYQIKVFRDLINHYKDEQIFRYIALIADYESPFWQKPEKMREPLAAEECFGKKAVPPHDPDGETYIRDAIMVYTEIQYDHIEEQLQTALNSHYQYTTILKDAKVLNSNGQVNSNIVSAIKTVQALLASTEEDIDRLKKKVVERRLDDNRSRGDKKDSWLSAYLQKKEVNPIENS